MAVVEVVEGRLTLPEEVRVLLGILPRDPLVLRREGDHMVAFRATPPRAAGALRRPVRATVRRLRPGPAAAD